MDCFLCWNPIELRYRMHSDNNLRAGVPVVAERLCSHSGYKYSGTVKKLLPSSLSMSAVCSWHALRRSSAGFIFAVALGFGLMDVGIFLTFFVAGWLIYYSLFLEEGKEKV